MSGVVSSGVKRPMLRIQTNFVALRERQFLTWACARTPQSITPDGLTAFGVAGALVVFAGYALCRVNPGFVWLATLGFVMHWLGDSLDGSLARFRRIERPNYGYFLDHSTDAICNLVIIVGLGFSPIARMDVALLTLCGYFMMSMHVFLRNHVAGVFQLTFWGLGPTEIRLALVLINTCYFFFGPRPLRILGWEFTPYDLALLAASAAFLAIFVFQTAPIVAMLRRDDNAFRLKPEDRPEIPR